MAVRITYDVSKPWGSQTQKLASLCAQAQAFAPRMITAMNSMSSGGAGPFTQLELEFGLAAGTGQAFYTLIANLKANLAVLDVSEIDQGTNVTL